MLHAIYYLIVFVSGYVPESLSPIVEFINNKTHFCLKEDNRSMQNKLFDAISSNLCKPIKLTNSSAVFALKKTDCVIKRFKEKRNSSRNEIKIAMELEHPNIIVNYVAFYQNYKNQNIGWIVSEYLDVPIVKKNFKNENEIRKMCRDVCKGLSYMHERDIAHLDMKLGNIMGKKTNTTKCNQNFEIDLMKEVQADMGKEKFKLQLLTEINMIYPFLESINGDAKNETSRNNELTSGLHDYEYEDKQCRFFGEASQHEYTENNSIYESEIGGWSFTDKNEDSKKEIKLCIQNITEEGNKFYNANYYFSKNNVHGTTQDYDDYFASKKPKLSQKNYKSGQDDIVYKIIDFGFSRYIKGDGVIDLNNKYYGTYPYSPPEIYFDSVYSKKSDIWCLGAMVYFLTTTKKLFYHSNGERNYDEFENFLKEHIGYSFGNYSSDLKDFVKKCMTRNYKERPTAEQLLKHPFLQKIF
ncbi:hypothetical protein BDAP_002591 [Binucleata daphniae]